MNNEIKFYAALVWRRLPWFLLVFTVFAMVGILTAITLPAIYQSRVRLIVESSQIPGQLAQSTVELPKQEQLQLFEARLLTRENLLNVAQKLNVFNGQNQMNPDQMVEAMRANTKVNSSTGRDEATIMTLVFDSPNPNIAAGVLSEYLTFILEEDAEYRSERATQTQDFFAEEVDRLTDELDIQSARLLAFKTENADALPESLEYRRDLRLSLQERIVRNEDEIVSLLDQRERLVKVFEASGEFDTPAAVKNETAEERRLRELKAQFADLSSVYAADSPRIKSLRSRIDLLQASILPPDSADIAQDEISTAKRMLDLQLSEIDAKVASLTQKNETAERTIADLDLSITRTPENGVKIESLQRDYENTQDQYNKAADRLAKASTGERIETLSRGQRVTVIEQPSVPTAPTRPNRKKIAAAGVGAGFLFGAALIALLELLSSAPKRSKDLVNAIGITPIATIPYTRTQAEQTWRRAKVALASFFVGTSIPTLVWALHTYYMPVDTIVRKVLEKAGLML
ncbi:GumC family protein [Celeribacter marinus]|uniref:GumC family protein n=1 Tax=Celeribacter marinus TaxID=1397108 RepID=UPI003F6BEB8F